MRFKKAMALIFKAIALASFMLALGACANGGVLSADKQEHYTALEVRLRWLIANPVVAAEVDPALPYQDLLYFLLALKALESPSVP